MSVDNVMMLPNHQWTPYADTLIVQTPDDQIESGQEFDIERLDRGDYRLTRRATAPNDGLLAWLLACPEKDFYVAIESESTDSL